MHEYKPGTVYANRYHSNFFRKVTEKGNLDTNGYLTAYERGIDTADWKEIDAPDWPRCPTHDVGNGAGFITLKQMFDWGFNQECLSNHFDPNEVEKLFRDQSMKLTEAPVG